MAMRQQKEVRRLGTSKGAREGRLLAQRGAGMGGRDVGGMATQPDGAVGQSCGRGEGGGRQGRWRWGRVRGNRIAWGTIPGAGGRGSFSHPLFPPSLQRKGHWQKRGPGAQ